MKRSEINAALRELEAICVRERCYLPPFCYFTPEEWKEKGHEYDEVRNCMLGWDITDYGKGDFDHFGMSLITIRNGCRAMPDKYPKVYAEKLLYMKEGQYSPNAPFAMTSLTFPVPTRSELFEDATAVAFAGKIGTNLISNHYLPGKYNF